MKILWGVLVVALSRFALAGEGQRRHSDAESEDAKCFLSECAEHALSVDDAELWLWLLNFLTDEEIKDFKRLTENVDHMPVDDTPVNENKYDSLLKVIQTRQAGKSRWQKLGSALFKDVHQLKRVNRALKIAKGIKEELQGFHEDISVVHLCSEEKNLFKVSASNIAKLKLQGELSDFASKVLERHVEIVEDLKWSRLCSRFRLWFSALCFLGILCVFKAGTEIQL